MTTRLSFHTFVIHFYLILFWVDMILVSGQCQIKQQSILLQFKHNLTFDSSLSTKLVSWDPNVIIDCCNWTGVDCSTQGQVIGLDLSYETISSPINDSSALFDLDSLESLNLAGNNFNFIQIPSRFGSLSSLSYLNLSNSKFSGQIPVELSQLLKLEVLDLSEPFSYGIGSLKLEKPNLATLVENLTRLTGLYLDNVNISSQRSDWSKGLSSSLLKLEVLSLSNCQLSGPLDDSLQRLQSLSEIRLGLNNLSAPVPEFFASFKNLTAMNLGACNLNGTFPQIVFRLQKLQLLDLSFNMNLFGSLPDFPLNGSLRSLVLTETNFYGGIPDTIVNLKNLSRIELPTSTFSGPIPKSMENLTQLAYLDLSANNFSGEIPSFQMCKNLTHIDLSRNSLSGTIPSVHFQNLQNLVYVDLRFNGFSGIIPPSLFSLQQVQKILLSYNKFDGLIPNFSNPSAFSLDMLDLSSNKLDGEIPKTLFELGKLSILLLSSNNLSGSISIDFQGCLTSLTTLDLSFNNLSIITAKNHTLVNRLPNFASLNLASCNLVEFPNLRNQTGLTNLDLSNNKIEGEIPSWIWSVGNESTGLTYLNLSNNRLTGIQEPYHFPDLLVLDLHSNLLNGSIPVPPQTANFIDYSKNRFNSILPEAMGTNLTFAYLFSVSDNLLTGGIPQTICNAAYLRVLDMSNNNLSGRIPKCFFEFGSILGVLNLGNNSLSGQIEGTFPSTCGLNTLDLHGNSLEGKIPRSLVNCTMLEVLNLGSNKIYDSYPCSLGNNTNLRVLVLRSNRLHGNVTCADNQQNNWSKLQILDIAFNDLSGNVPTKSFWQSAAMMTEDPSSKKHLSFTVLQLTEFSYQDTVQVTMKGLNVELVKILTIFTSIDISSNHFSGEIPTSIGRLGALYLLNLSNNEFTGPIPSYMGNLSQLESLDMSRNRLTGEIPQTLSSLTFLSFLNLSFNQLTGRIPTGSQFQTFETNSYLGNKGLCGFPLNITCTSSILPIPKDPKSSQESKKGNDWLTVFHGMGAGAGTSIVMAILYSIYKRNTGRSRQINLSR